MAPWLEPMSRARVETLHCKFGETFVTGKNDSGWFLHLKSVTLPTCVWGVTPSQIKSDFDASLVRMKTALVASQTLVLGRNKRMLHLCRKTSDVPITVTKVYSVFRIRCCVPRVQPKSDVHPTCVCCYAKSDQVRPRCFADTNEDCTGG